MGEKVSGYVLFSVGLAPPRHFPGRDFAEKPFLPCFRAFFCPHAVTVSTFLDVRAGALTHLRPWRIIDWTLAGFAKPLIRMWSNIKNSEFSEKFGILQPLSADQARKKDFANRIMNSRAGTKNTLRTCCEAAMNWFW
jgi:hypothetical protein